MTASRPETPKQKAKALYEFKGQIDKEIDLEPVRCGQLDCHAILMMDNVQCIICAGRGGYHREEGG